MQHFKLNSLYDQFVRPYNPALRGKPESMDPTYAHYLKSCRGKPTAHKGHSIRDSLFKPPPEACRMERLSLQGTELLPGPIPDFDTSLLERDAVSVVVRDGPGSGSDKVPQKRFSLKLNFAAAPPSSPHNTDAAHDRKKKRKPEEGITADKKPKKKRKHSSSDPNHMAHAMDQSSDIDILN